MYYTFHRSVYSPLHSIFPEPHESLGPSAAYTELQRRGCTLATKEWVDNHWSLLLWKLAGMALLNPTQEMTVETRRWSWAGIMHQLLYRYERELNCGSRPPLRMIATQDTPASLPMVLCVSNIFWSEGGIAEDGTPVEPYPELELTDGWYKLKAKIDPPMARAVRRGIVATGRKIGITGAWLSCEKKEPMEILEAYNSVKLVVSANSSHLVPWHHKLGFKRGGPFLATLNKLSPDGGNICALDAIVLKMYPIAYIEFREDENGNKISEGPRNEAEEAKVSEGWRVCSVSELIQCGSETECDLQRRREVEASKLHEALGKKQARFEGYIDRLERKAGPRFHPGEDDNVDNLFDELEDPTEAGAVIGRLSPKDAGWLAQHIRRRLESDRERVGEEIEKELESICPPRSVRNFRVIVVKDGSTMRRPSYRTAQITVWDVMNLSFYEGEPGGTFQVGHRYMVTNLNPTHHTSWMGRYEEGAEVYMATGRHSRWRKLNKYGFAV
ncbi:hypothetical protein BDQ12DRAFT_598942 [Crucibulum laeve]|uniref:BRCA2 OB1 domain-containing protein n=1 Tax=Crucibulum laeve TaxID=68775 RepID=A0A5C3M970_9AGAR|nr:hypothetical protein BDQ12DRAFT_598942 [Crucibulum laeve]